MNDAPDATTEPAGTALELVQPPKLVLTRTKSNGNPIRKLKVTRQQWEFCLEYAKCWNGAKAARRSGYAPDSADVTASKLLSKKTICEAVAEAMRQLGLSKEHVLSKLGVVARADISDLFVTGPDGKATLELDPDKVAANGHLIKSLKANKFGHEVEMHDPMKAIELMARILRMTGNDVQNQVNVQFNVNIPGESV